MLYQKLSEILFKLQRILYELKNINMETNNKQTENGNKLYLTAKSLLGRDASPQDTAPDSLGCADTVNKLVEAATGSPIERRLISTYRMYQLLKQEKHRFQIVPQGEMLPGDIIISPTGYGNARALAHGHCGIIGENEKILSNSSETGLLRENYTMTSWRKIYAETGEYPIIIFRLI
jgi:hypothetical protein